MNQLDNGNIPSKYHALINNAKLNQRNTIDKITQRERIGEQAASQRHLLYTQKIMTILD